MAATTQKIIVSMVDAHGNSIEPKPLTVTPPADMDKLLKRLASSHGAGNLLDECDDLVLADVVPAGNYKYRVTGAGGAAGGSGAGGAAGGSAALERIEEGVALISRVLPIVMVSIKEQFGPPTTASRGSNAPFRRSIMQYYGMTQQSGKLRCMVLDELLPKEFVCAGHLLACKHKAYSQVLLGFEDISDPRNGLLWNSAIEEVYELQQVCFSFIQGWTFRIHVIDKGLMDVKLGDVGKDKNNAAFKNLMADRTFRELDNKVVEFRGRGGVGPFKRALAFQAMNALATQQARYPDHFNPGDHKFDYMSEFDGKDELIKAWLNDSHDNEYD